MRDGRESDATAYILLGGRTRISLDIGDLEAHNPGKVHIQRPQSALVSRKPCAPESATANKQGGAGFARDQKESKHTS